MREIKGIVEVPVIFSIEERGDKIILLTKSPYLNLEAIHNKKVEIKVSEK